MTENGGEIRAETVRTRRLVIEDDQGRTTFEIAMQVGADGAPALRFNDKHGRTRILMEITGDDMAGLTVLDADEVPRARIVVAADGQPTMMVDHGTRLIRQTFTR
ncbi:MAG: hypothetical protein NVS3B7_18260 [Candidatus Elarobacter sp.]